jgi:hypothetical protein
MYPEERGWTLKSLTTRLSSSSAFLLLFLVVCSLRSRAEEARVRPQHAAAIVRAVEDEIYDYSLQQAYEDIGTAITKNTRQVNVYIYANATQRDAYNVIYKLPPPYGEIYRMVQINDNGLAFLFGRPEKGFPPSGPAYSTVYMDDDGLCKTKATAEKFHFEIQLEPTKDRTGEAIARQKQRYGYSALEETNAGSYPKHK